MSSFQVRQIIQSMGTMSNNRRARVSTAIIGCQGTNGEYTELAIHNGQCVGSRMKGVKGKVCKGCNVWHNEALQGKGLASLSPE